MHPVFAILGAGAAGFGASVLGLGCAVLISQGDIGYGLLIALPLGGLVTTLWSDVDALYTALGQALYFAVILFAAGAEHRHRDLALDVTRGLVLAVVGAIAGFLLGAIGGAIGVKLRPSAKTAIPEARRVH